MKLSLTLPGQNAPIPTPEGLKPEINNLGSLVAGFLNVALYLALFFTFFWLVWASFQYIVASGKKEELSKARARITWALIGLIVIFAAFFIAKLGGVIFPSRPSPGASPIPGGGLF